MFRKLFALFLASTLFIACSGSGNDPESSPADPLAGKEITSSQLDRSLVSERDLGDEWTSQDAAPSTVQIGGRVGPENIEQAAAEATSAFSQKDASGRISNSVYAVANEAIAQAVMAEHTVGDETKTWTQELKDGTTASFRNEGEIAKLPRLGDETYSAKLTVQIEDAQKNRFDSKIEYVVYRVGRVMSFIVAQDAGVSTLARKQEGRLARVLEL